MLIYALFIMLERTLIYFNSLNVALKYIHDRIRFLVFMVKLPDTYIGFSVCLLFIVYFLSPIFEIINNLLHPLHYNAQMGNIAIVMQELDSGVNPDEFDFKLETPLHRAATAGHSEIVQLLVNRGANVNVQKQEVQRNDYVSKSVVLLALENGHKDVAVLLIERNATIGCPELVCASRAGNLNIMKSMVDMVKDVSCKVSVNCTILEAKWKKKNPYINCSSLPSLVLRSPLHEATEQGHKGKQHEFTIHSQRNR